MTDEQDIDSLDSSEDVESRLSDTLFQARNDKLSEIEEMERYLRRQRSDLLKQAAWYKKPGNWIGILAIIVSISLFATNWLLGQENKELSASYSKIETLTSLTPSIRSKTRILFEGKDVPFIGKIRIRIKNSGTVSIQASDFQDGPIKFRISSESGASASDSSADLPFLLDLKKSRGSGQRLDKLHIVSSSNPAVFTYLPSILNKGEHVDFEAYVSASENVSVSRSGKIMDGNIKRIVLEKEELATVSSVRTMIKGWHDLAGGRLDAILFSLLFLVVSVIPIGLLVDEIYFVDVLDGVMMIPSILLTLALGAFFILTIIY